MYLMDLVIEEVNFVVVSVSQEGIDFISSRIEETAEGAEVAEDLCLAGADSNLGVAEDYVVLVVDHSFGGSVVGLVVWVFF